jgi:hypothetical protein
MNSCNPTTTDQHQHIKFILLFLRRGIGQNGHITIISNILGSGLCGQIAAKLKA